MKKKRAKSDGGSGGLLCADGVAAEKRIQEDIDLISRAVREGWDVPPQRKPVIVERMVGIVERKTVQKATATGPVDDEHAADTNAIRAAAVLVSMTSERQRDIHAADKNERLDKGKATERMDGVVLRVLGVQAED